MAAINYSYPNGGFNLSTDISGIGGGGGVGLPSNPDLDFMREMARRRAAQQEMLFAQQQEDRQRAIRQQEDAQHNSLEQRNTLGSQNMAMDNLRQAAEVKQLQAMMRPAPTKARPDLGNTSAGVFEVDPGAMNAYQRKAYLPSGSSMSGDINDTLLGGTIGFGDTNPGGYSPGGHAPRSRRQGVIQDQQAPEDDTRADWGGLRSYGRYNKID